MKTLSVTAIGIDAEPRSTLATAVTAEGYTGSGTTLTVQAFANGISINEKTVQADGATWSCTIDGEVSLPTTLKVTVADEDGNEAQSTRKVEPTA